jgi:hypothetical protein
VRDVRGRVKRMSNRKGQVSGRQVVGRRVVSGGKGGGKWSTGGGVGGKRFSGGGSELHEEVPR